MSEAYLFALHTDAQPAAALTGVLRAGGALPAWVSAVHWLGQPQPEALPDRALYAWPESPLLASFALQSLARALQGGAFSLAVLGESAPQGALALLLGAPAAVGRWNLPPLARLTPLPVEGAAPEDFLAGAAAQAAQTLPEESELALVGAHGLEEALLRQAFAGATVLVTSGGLSQAAQMVDAMQRGEHPNALLLDYAPGGGLALLLEKL